jgi:hypothetical protein
VTCTALWRGYVGQWEISENRLYLVGLEGKLRKGDTKASLETFFPGSPKRVLADWYSGEIRVPQGKLLDYVHGGYASTYEVDLFLSIKNGVVTKSEKVFNGVTDHFSADDDYAVRAMTVWPGESA